jgi:hypothetical protein
VVGHLIKPLAALDVPQEMIGQIGGVPLPRADIVTARELAI